MKLITFRNGFRDTIANRVTRGDVSHFNLRHGTRLARGWEVTMGVDDNIVSKELDAKDYDVAMTDDNYILLPIYARGTTRTIRDAKGNRKFFISKDNASDHNRVLLFLNLPKVAGVTYELYGAASTVSIGAEVLYTVGQEDEVIDAPVVLLDGESAITIKYQKNDEPRVERIIFTNGNLQYIDKG